MRGLRQNPELRPLPDGQRHMGHRQFAIQHDILSPATHTFLCGLGMFPSGPDCSSMWPAPGLLEQSFCMLEAFAGGRGEDSEVHVLDFPPTPRAEP